MPLNINFVFILFGKSEQMVFRMLLSHRQNENYYLYFQHFIIKIDIIQQFNTQKYFQNSKLAHLVVVA